VTETTPYRQLQQEDAACLWHPYASATDIPEIFPVVSANGVRLTLADGRQIIDGMASWWSAIHGYSHPVLNRAAKQQLDAMSHVMFGGLTHPAAVRLGKLLCDLTPPTLDRVFFSDSGSVAVEVALKMAIQYWYSSGNPRKQKLVALRSGYHGDTFGAMSVCDPVTGMHHLFGDVLAKHHFIPAPECPFGSPCPDSELQALTELLSEQHQDIAAVVVEPIVQGAGGMRFYSADNLVKLRALCDAFDVLLIFDEIATGFGRTGKMFALEHAGIEPDILCLGKALTGGYLSLAATLCNRRISEGISQGEAGVFMHGPTFMANPLACAIACASIELLLSQPWQRSISRLEEELTLGLGPAAELGAVREVRTLGAIGVIELHEPVDMKTVQPRFVERGIWCRPFGKLIYTMPSYTMGSDDVATLTAGMVDVASTL
jgi:adenosylmethionine-8-amino-7-oxononanoate aminotransferase